jgi:hypothetical protein
MRQSMTRIPLAVVLALTALIGACETSVDIDFPTHEPLLMINSFFWPDTRFELYLGEAVDIETGEGGIDCVSDGTVELWQNDQRLETFPHVGGCLYRSASRRPQPGVPYTIRASARGYRNIEATDAVPLDVPTDFEYTVSRRGQSVDQIDVTITLSDPADVQNWYRLMVFYRHHGEGEVEEWYNVPGFKTDDEAIVVENQDFIDIGDGATFLETAYFSDDRITPNNHRLEIQIPGPFTDGSERIDLVVSMDGVSKQFFDYATSYRVQQEVGDNPFTEPVQVTTNVKNGFGIFAGLNRRGLDVQIQ